ncbi:UDP-N-acetylmuramate:L-alanyl-gamma-D-glutamyl-meso-diaminopimelate ligase [Acidithiobacillus sp. IBUN Pt1247-S3]|uniref:UDP-N-acetylmuramate:L-alanyl-gamma-D-glutamyl- meso-diaminopimelate ligase n=1 Tax=Acidithiobacillus sp. IBUN Pt1247-S3 TaxID=3166642 RepID=UPI0034E56A87
MRIHILGICGTFMASLALLARAAGHEVSGVDAQAYPPMSDLLAREGIAVEEGYDRGLPDPLPDLVVIGNALSRGNPQVELVLRLGLPYHSGAEWLAQEILSGRWVLAVAGTHGKSSTSAMLTWILEYAGLEPGFLVGAELNNFANSARLTDSPFFVIEADEYDTAFFDKRAKFVHYHPRTLILNNLEYDHADIYPDLAAIETQFHYLIRTVPDNGLILRPASDAALERVWQRGHWTPELLFGDEAGWHVRLESADASQFSIWNGQERQGEVQWQAMGEFNAQNALAAILAARHAGVPMASSCAALAEYRGLRRRLELRGTVRDIAVYDDFAHHPTAIAKTIAALHSRVGAQTRILAVLEPRSNTMKLGIHEKTLGPSLAEADTAFLYVPADLGWNPENALPDAQVYRDFDALIAAVVAEARPGDQILVMSNGGFGGIHGRLLQALEKRA